MPVISNINIVPTGTIISFGGPTPPEDYLICDGSQITRAVYPELFQAIGTHWGEGDGTTTFHLPDLRGNFIRGQAQGSGNDPDRAARTASAAGGMNGDQVGSSQSFAVQKFTGRFAAGDNVNNSGNLFYAFEGVMYGSSQGQVYYSDHDGGSRNNYKYVYIDNSRQVTTSTEVRPKNVYVLYIIKV